LGATLLDGKKLAQEIEREVAREVELLRETGIIPSLTVVLLGDHPASKIYVRSKEKTCKRLGIISNTLLMPHDTSQEEILGVVGKLNLDPSVDGILVQQPLPDAVDPNVVLESIDPAKDVDGFTPANMGRLLMGRPHMVACTPAGILELLDAYEVPIEGADVVIIGRSNIVGKPLAALLMQKAGGRNCTVSVCHSGTKDIARYTREADMVVTAMGQPAFLTADMVRPGCIVVDVGMNRVNDPAAPKGYRLTGDADFEPLSEIASFITPVPGGVGPLTVAMLMRNTLKAARFRRCPG
jgi:methylenetetrahydrofolate dehydrogenase (NADP+)/methenyltetrahydrofolate cyclohydrolase